MARCPKCGQDSPDQARFCRVCGNRLSGAREAEAPDATLTSEQRAQRLLEEAFRLSEQGRVLAAIQTCQQALSLTPNSTSAHSLLGTLYQRQGDRDRAIREYEQVLTLSPESTVERRLLNELMGVPTAARPVLVSPRTARVAVTGASVAVALLVIAAVLLTRSNPAPGPSRPTPAPPPATRAARPVEVVSTTPPPPTPGSAWPGLTSPFPTPVFRPSPPAAAGPAAPGASAPAGPVIIPATGAERYYARPGALAPAPMTGAVEYGGVPVVGSGAWSPPAAGWSAQAGRDYFLQGDYARAAQTYRTYLERTPAAGGGPREELGWVYMQMGERDLATQQYQQALSSYEYDVQRGHNVEAARHGLRTCQSAIRALETR